MLKNIFLPDIMKRSFVVAVIVGSVLNLINQGDKMIGGGAVDLLKCALTYMVPYCVATYGAVSALASNAKDRN